MKRLAAAVLLFGVPCLAQELAPLQVLVGTTVLDAHTGKIAGAVPAAFENRNAWFGPQQYGADGVVVDTARGQVLATVGTACVLRDLAGTELWTAKDLIGRRAESLWGQARFAGERVIVPLGRDGLAGLDRKDGTVVWSSPACGQKLFTVDGDLVLAVRDTATGALVTALAVQNGAKAFAMAQPRPPYFLRPSPAGIALSTPEGLVVVDRTGPELFRVPGPVVDAACGREFWFVLRADALAAFDRRGIRVWQQDLPATPFEQRYLSVLPDGAPVLCAYSPMADSGCVVSRRDPHDGGEVWQRTVAGLGIGHSKYWHEAIAQAVGGALVVTSHAAGGSFVVVLDPATGEVQQRHEAKRG